MADRTITPTAREAEPDVQPEEAPDAAAPKARTAGGFKAWLPLLVTVAVMPALSFATVQFLLVPKMKKAFAQPAAASTTEAPGKDAAAGARGAKPGKIKVTVPLPKILVNVAGTMMTRYLMTSVTLVGNTVDFKDKIDANKDQLIDVANGALSTKTIADLEKPGARNVIRAELMTVFNNALGGPVVQDIYITEQAIQ
jgi:flagellar FliL protein